MRNDVVHLENGGYVQDTYPFFYVELINVLYHDNIEITLI